MTHLRHVTLHVFSILDQHSLQPKDNLAHWVLAAEEGIITFALARQAEASMTKVHSSRQKPHTQNNNKPLVVLLVYCDILVYTRY
jgi:hypothetical protein